MILPDVEVPDVEAPDVEPVDPEAAEAAAAAAEDPELPVAAEEVFVLSVVEDASVVEFVLVEASAVVVEFDV